MADSENLTKQDDVLCGPLLRYTYIDHNSSIWHGSILVVLLNNGPNLSSPWLQIHPAQNASPPAIPLISQINHTFWRFNIAIQLKDEEQEVTYSISFKDSDGSGRESSMSKRSFWVPAGEDTMRILFHTCNGFSLGVKPESSAGPVLWKDVLRIHAKRPFHVMIGGGDQVYSDGVRATGPLKDWATKVSPRGRAKKPLTKGLEYELDEWYFQNYCSWFRGDPFSNAAASIPTVQIFDDHDIIDGYGSYPDRFMRAPIFLGIGRVAWKYYMLFQQHTPPKGEAKEDPSWVIGTDKGPYIQERSRSICTTFGKRVVFYGLDCRVDRTIDRVCHESTYNNMFDRLEKDVVKGQTKHLILLLGVPIAYPRLVWLENLLSAHTVTPLKWLNKLFGVAGGAFNKFDGAAELLDDLNDHWCAGTHKEERNKFVERLQVFSARKEVRITILSGDVHLACVGRFFSNASLNTPQNKDPRYMVNVVSSAITNAPPPTAVANLLARRNKLHHLDKNTDENLMNIFFQNPDGKQNTVNQATLPARNYCIITEHAGLSNETDRQRSLDGDAKLRDIGEGEGGFRSGVVEGGEIHGDMIIAHKQTGGVDHPSASTPLNGTTRKYALDVSIRAEIDPKDCEGRATAYGFAIPILES